MLSHGRFICLHSCVVSKHYIKQMTVHLSLDKQDNHKTCNNVQHWQRNAKSYQHSNYIKAITQHLFLSPFAAFFCAYLGSAIANIMSRVSTHFLSLIYQLLITGY